MGDNLNKPDFIFETSWEICNKVGGINTVVATKAPELTKKFQNNLIFIGPDIRRKISSDNKFEEDNSIFPIWREAANEEGLRLRIGRWKIHGNPIVILVDYTPFIANKDEIFTNYWETHKLDSLKGGHDYIEAAMFGHAAGKTIESFWKYHLSVREKVIAHFHEWMTGTGLLYLNLNVPHIATLFTTHATVTGRALAGNGHQLYKNLSEYHGDSVARELNVVPQQSLEKLSAHYSDCFTTVSEITAKECKQLLEKEVDIVTPNGFDDSFVPSKENLPEIRQNTKEKMREVTKALLNQDISEDPFMTAISGRNEFHNKGVDVFIEMLGKLNTNENLQKNILAFIMIPSNNYGPRRDLLDKLQNKTEVPLPESFLTHELHEADEDIILNAIRDTGLQNNEEDKVKIIYIPSYLNGDDGIFNMKYYDILGGMDLTIFPSYYEPWGYTPLESLAYRVPTITTNLAGIGMWINKKEADESPAIDVFDRIEMDKDKLTDRISERVAEFSNKTEDEIEEARESAYSLSRIALWKNLIEHYEQAYGIALNKVKQRPEKLAQYKPEEYTLSQKIYKSNTPIWKGLVVEPNLPEKFKALDELSRNLWWSWNYEALELFEYIDPKLWQEANKNPFLLLKEVPYERFAELEKDEVFENKFNTVYEKFDRYIKEKPREGEPSVAYFSMEYGLHSTIKIYSGGLGILAGDYLKEASDNNYDMVAIGLMFKFGYFTQQLSVKGEQLVSYEAQNFSNLPIESVKDENGNWLTVQIIFPGREVYLRIWKLMVGRIPLYLLDSDFEANKQEDRMLTHHLYGGGNEHRLQQEILLGIGGKRALNKMNINPDLYHINEGHAALLGIERLNNHITNMNYTFNESLEIVRASTLFTTHTPVAAGHDEFAKDLLMAYLGHYPNRLNISFEQFMNLGRMRPGDKNQNFSLSVLAVKTAQEVNGVSKLHGKISQDMFKQLWDGYFTEEIPVRYVTNGIHLPTWIDKDWKEFYINTFGKQFLSEQSNKEHWDNIHKVRDKQIWNLRNQKRKELIESIKDRLNAHWINKHVNPRTIFQVKNNLNEKTLTIGFARRFATYKRAYLLFKDEERLKQIVNNQERPVQFVFAGKAHPADEEGQNMIKHIVNISNKPEFLGKIIFLENYDMELASYLVQGVDIWLNTPTRPLEASGTSGMKAVLNGVLNFSVLDGWWIEGYREDAGWSLPMEKNYNDQNFQDELDAETIYSTLENDIIPKFYTRNKEDVPKEWVQFIKNSIAHIAPEFTTKRMIDDYYNHFYKNMYHRVKTLRENECKNARKIARWKKKIIKNWDNIEVKKIDFPDSTTQKMVSGETYKCRVVIDLKKLSDIKISVEIIITENLPEGETTIVDKFEMKQIKKEGSLVTYEADLVPPRPGTFSYGVRITPVNDMLPYRQDFPYIKWV